MKKNFTKFISYMLASTVAITSMGIVSVQAAEVTNEIEQSKAINSKYNSFDFIKENIPTVP